MDEVREEPRAMTAITTGAQKEGCLPDDVAFTLRGDGEADARTSLDSQGCLRLGGRGFTS